MRSQKWQIFRQNFWNASSGLSLAFEKGHRRVADFQLSFIGTCPFEDISAIARFQGSWNKRKCQCPRLRKLWRPLLFLDKAFFEYAVRKI